MSRSPLDYYTAGRPEPVPRLSKLAITALVFSLVSAVLLCGPILPMIRRAFPLSMQALVLLAIPTIGLILSVTALLRILNALDELYGEGIAIAGMITNVVTWLIVIMFIAMP
jgi:hypothetical protein